LRSTAVTLCHQFTPVEQTCQEEYQNSFTDFECLMPIQGVYVFLENSHNTIQWGRASGQYVTISEGIPTCELR